MTYLFTWLALGLGILADYLFYKEMPGISVPIFTLVFLGVVWVLDRREHKRLGVVAGLWSVGALAAASAFALRANEGVLLLNGAWLVILTLLVLAAAYGVELRVISLFAPVRWLVEAVPSAWVEGLGKWNGWLPGWKLHGRAWRAVGWSAAIGAIFFVLLFSAEPALREMLARILSAEMLREGIVHIFVVGLSGFAFLVALSALKNTAHSVTHNSASHQEQGTDYSLEWVSVLGTSNAVFALFLFARFFEKVQMGTVVYSQAAREGFFSLVVAAALVAAMLWLRRFLMAKEYVSVQKVLEGLFVVQTLVVLMGSVSRLNDYIFVYGLTYPRLAAWVVMWLIGVWVLALIVASLSEKVTTTHVWHVLIGTVCVALFGVTLANPEALVVKYTLARSTELTYRDLTALGRNIALDGYSRELVQTMRVREDACIQQVQGATTERVTTECGSLRKDKAFIRDGLSEMTQRVSIQLARYQDAHWMSWNMSKWNAQQFCDDLNCTDKWGSCGEGHVNCIERGE